MSGARGKWVTPTVPLSNTPIWMVRPVRAPFTDDLSARLPLSSQWDLVVVGAGLVGLLVAHEASRLGMKVAVVEARRVGGRASGHGLGMATVLRGDRYAAIRRSSGLETAAECVRWSAAGLDRLGAIVDELHLACGWTPATTYLCATTEEGAALVDDEAAALTACGYASYASAAEELPFRTSAALAVDGGAHLDPYALCLGLAGALAARGVPVVEDTRVLAIEEDRSGVRLAVPAGSVAADRVVVATQFPIVGPNRLIGRLWATRERVVAGVSEPLAGRLRGMYTSVDDAGWSCRPHTGAGDGWTLMSGGAQQLRVASDSLTQRQHVAEQAERRLAMQVSRAWSLPGVATDTGVPLIGPTSRRSRCTTVTGLSAWGPAGAAAAAQMAAALVSGGDVASAELFDPTRRRPRTPIDVVRGAWPQARHPATGVSLPALPTLPLAPGSGLVARSGRASVAVSCDGEGNTVMLQARCSHRGCVVRFDDAEQQWECPCHGSRFDLSGAVVDGPATTPLQPFRPVA